MDVGQIPSGLREGTVTRVSDGCALHRDELAEGQQVTMRLTRAGEDITVSFPGTTLPTLTSEGHTEDRFRTRPRESRITAQDGRCSAMRTQRYEGQAVPPAAYEVSFLTQDDMPMGSCGSTPIPCLTTITMRLRFCPSPVGCGGDLQ